MEHDRLSNVPATKAAQAAFKAVDAVQDLPGAEQVMGLMLATMCVITGLRLDPSDVYHMTCNLIYRATQQHNEHVEALINYTKDDIQ